MQSMFQILERLASSSRTNPDLQQCLPSVPSCAKRQRVLLSTQQLSTKRVCPAARGRIRRKRRGHSFRLRAGDQRSQSQPRLQWRQQVRPPHISRVASVLTSSSRFVWFVPVFTTDVAKAATSFDVLIQAFEDSKLADLAKRAGGDFRYVVPRADRKLPEKIVEVGVVRSDVPLTRPPSGWHGYCFNDLSKGRKKGCLYVVWKTVSTNSWCVKVYRTRYPAEIGA